MKETDFTRVRALSGSVVIGRMVRGQEVAVQTAVNKVFRAVGEGWRVVTARA